MPWWATRGAAVMAWATAGWPVWRWYVARIGDGSDEPFGIAALAAALVFVRWRRMREPVSCGAAVVAGGAAAMVCLGFDFLPALVRGALWMLALVALLGGTGPAVARAGLLLLSLPVVATAQFYLGYPLRAVTAACSVPLLRLLGYVTERQGTALRWAGETVLVDAPCSGIQMLWTGLLAACVLAAVQGLAGGATFRLLRQTALAVFLANVVRCTGLFLLEVRGGMPPAWLHEGLGLALFAAALGVVVWRAGSGSATQRRAADKAEDGGGHVPVAASMGMARGVAADWVVPLLGLLLVGVAVRPLFGDEERVPIDVLTFPGWPTTFEGRVLTPLASSGREARFAAGFPGQVRAFTDGERTVILRWVPRETRKLHPAAHCLRGLGYAVRPGPVWRDSAGRCWGTSVAEREGRKRKVRERIGDSTGRDWTDVSAWWWDAWRGGSTGPWWAETVIEE